MTRLAELVAVSGRVAATGSRLAKIASIAAFLRRLDLAEVRLGIAYLSGDIPQGRLAVGHGALREAMDNPAPQPRLELADVHRAFTALTGVGGRGAARQRAILLRTLFEAATAEEQDFLSRLMVGELRQGALEGVMLEAVAAAADTPVAEVRRAATFAGNLAPVARAALAGQGLQGFSVRLMQPVLPMLAQPAKSIEVAMAALGEALLEWKLDGARVQVHKQGRRVRVFTRNLNDVTDRVPEILEWLAGVPGEMILDGEAIALRPDGRPHPFQVTMRRFGRRLDVPAQRAELPLAVFFFDCLLLDGVPLVDCGAEERHDALRRALPEPLLAPFLVTGDVDRAARFYAEALARGHEGVMAKALAAPYEAGRRGSGWLKVKRTRTLDLVVLAAEWGHGRRRGRLSNLHLGARDPSGGFVMLGKTFKGLTDEMLEWQTQELLRRETARDEWTVRVRPELVVEIEFNDVQESRQYPAGLALRFARVKGYRPDKRPEDADTIEAVRSIHRESLS